MLKLTNNKLREGAGKLPLFSLLLSLTALTSCLSFNVSADDLLNIPGNPAEADCEKSSSIIPTCLNGRQRATNAMELIIGDIKVCNCLSENRKFLSELPKIPKMTKEEEIAKLIKDQNLRAANLTAIQASSLSKNKRDLDESLLVYGGQEIRAKAKKESKPNTEVPKISETITTISSIPKENANWQCVTFQEYSVQREIPSDNNFFKILQASTEYRPEEWDVNTLKDRYDSASEVERNAIRLKLIFLSRNPIFASIFKASPSQKFSAGKLTEKKTELFQILRTLAPAAASTCFNVPGGCLNEIRSGKAYSDYSQNIGQFILNDEVVDIASAQASADYFAELKKITSERSVEGVPSSPEAYFLYLQNANRAITEECTGSTVDASCYTKFDNHCSQIRLIDSRVKKGIKESSSDLADILREEANVHVDMNPSTNANFKNFNDAICNTPYGDTNGESLTYFQYKEKNCGATSLPECSDRRKLLQRYMSSYSKGNDVSAQNLRGSFRSIIASEAPLAISEAQVRAANNVSETPAELRERFGGRIPEISPTGQLIPSRARPDQSRSRTDLLGDTSPSDDTFTRSPASTKYDSSVQPMAARSSGTRSTPDYQDKTPEAPKASTQSNSQSTQSRNNNMVLPTSFNTVVPETSNAPVENLPAPSFENQASSNSPTQISEAAEDQDISSVAGGSLSAGSSDAPTSKKSVKASGEGSGGFSGSRSRRETPRKENGLLFKYGLDQKAEPEVVLVARDQTSIKVNVDQRLLDRIKNNPNALEVSEEDWKKIFATPDEVVQLNVAEGVVVFAKKDGSGGLSFTMDPRAASSFSRGIRASVKTDVYDLISRDPDVYLNQNDLIMSQIRNTGASGNQIVEIVSSGRPALKFEAVKQGKFIYRFKPRR